MSITDAIERALANRDNPVIAYLLNDRDERTAAYRDIPWWRVTDKFTADILAAAVPTATEDHLTEAFEFLDAMRLGEGLEAMRGSDDAPSQAVWNAITEVLRREFATELLDHAATVTTQVGIYTTAVNALIIAEKGRL